MPERLYQLRFDENLKLSVPQNVTPEGFAGLEFDKGERLSRFVREVAERVSIQSPNDVAQYLLTKVYVPFEDFDQEEMWVLLLKLSAGSPMRSWSIGGKSTEESS
jgi:hypothetical protein